MVPMHVLTLWDVSEAGEVCLHYFEPFMDTQLLWLCCC